jgi:hypothetical protein
LAGGIQPPIPHLVQPQCKHCRYQRDHERFFGRVHEADRGPCQHRPPHFPVTPVTPPGGQRQAGKEHQQHFVDVILAIENHGGRGGGKEGSPQRAALAKPIPKQGQQQDNANPEQNGNCP